MKRKINIVICVVLQLVLGFAREYIFPQVNYALNQKWRNLTGENLDESMRFLMDLDYYTLYFGKFALTFIFSALFCLFTFWGIRVIFKSKKYDRWVLFYFGFIFVIALFIFLVGLPFSFKHDAYRISRHLSYLIQSPIGLVILILSVVLSKGLPSNLNSNSSNKPSK